MKPRDFLVEFFGKTVDTRFIFGAMRPQIKLSQTLVCE